MQNKTNQLSIRWDSEQEKLLLNYPDLNLTDYELLLDNTGDFQAYVIQNWMQRWQDKIYTHIGDTEQGPDETDFEYKTRREKEMPAFDCQFTEFGQNFTATFERETVQYVELLNLRNGNQTSLLENAEFFIDDQKCAILGSSPPEMEVMKIYCQDPNYKLENKFAEGYNSTQESEEFDGTAGTTLTIVPKTEGILKVCDLKIFAKKVDTELMQEYSENLKLCNEEQINCYDL